MNTIEKFARLCFLVEDTYPAIAGVWRSAPDRFGAAWVERFVSDLEVFVGDIETPENQALINMIDGYAEFVNDSLRSQVYYLRHGKYQSSSHAQCCAEYYHNEEHMTRRYLPGMWLTHYLWPQHYYMLAGFRQNVLERARGARTFIEVGVGCGIYSRTVLEALPEATGTGVDISAHSLAFTHGMVSRFGHGARYRTACLDIFDDCGLQCDLLVKAG